MSGFILLLIILLVYLFPCLVACFRHHINSNSIIVLNLFLGWTLIGWVVSLSWALTNDTKGAKQ